MGSAKKETEITEVMNLLREWDSGTKVTRKKILKNFINRESGKTGPELESEYAQAASLFFARLTAWLRLTYMVGTCLTEQLMALNIFLSASSGNKFLAEFLEIGGVLTTLEIICLKQAREVDKLQALKLLTHVANAGRKYKELICESYGIRAIAECLARSTSEETQECARNLLQILAHGNPKFELQVYRGLIALLPAANHKAQQMAAQTLRVVQPLVRKASPDIIEPLLNLLKTLHVEVQYEVIELIKDLMRCSEIRSEVLEKVVALLRPLMQDTTTLQHILLDPQIEPHAHPLSFHVQQAAAAKTIGLLMRESDAMTDQLLKMNAVHHLLYVMGNQDHADSQRQASIALELMCRRFPRVDRAVRKTMGEMLYTAFKAKPDSLYSVMTTVQADVLRSNKLDGTFG